MLALSDQYSLDGAGKLIDVFLAGVERAHPADLPVRPRPAKESEGWTESIRGPLWQDGKIPLDSVIWVGFCAALQMAISLRELYMSEGLATVRP